MFMKIFYKTNGKRLKDKGSICITKKLAKALDIPSKINFYDRNSNDTITFYTKTYRVKVNILMLNGLDILYNNNKISTEQVRKLYKDIINIKPNKNKKSLRDKVINLSLKGLKSIDISSIKYDLSDLKAFVNSESLKLNPKKLRKLGVKIYKNKTYYGFEESKDAYLLDELFYIRNNSIPLILTNINEPYIDPSTAKFTSSMENNSKKNLTSPIKKTLNLKAIQS